MLDARHALGASGEDQAAHWYSSQGWTILARNWRAGRQGELDIVAHRRGTIAFCEVKTRTSDAFGVPAEAVTPAKQARIRRLAAAWLAENDIRASAVRFDVASVLDGELEVIEAAF